MARFPWCRRVISHGRIPSPGQVMRLLLWLIFLIPAHEKAIGQRLRLSGAANYALNRPGVVMIRTEYTANVYVKSMRMGERAFNKLLDSIQRLDKEGGVPAEQKLNIVLQE